MSSANSFHDRAEEALRNPSLRAALDKAGEGFLATRSRAFASIENAHEITEAAKRVRERAVDGMADLLLLFEERARAQGVHVHWAETALQAREIVLALCAGKTRIVKGKSMASEEIGLNEALAQTGAEVIETDLGEYIVQLAEEIPSHIIAPAVHKTRAQIDALFRHHHGGQGGTTKEVTKGGTKGGASFGGRPRSSQALVEEARQVIRQKFLRAEVGITGTNMLVAERGAALLLTNEGNGDLSAVMAERHIVLAGIERIVADERDAAAILRVLARSATGQSLGTYVSLYSGTGNSSKDMHVVLLDNGRSSMHGGPWHDMLRCIRCGACLNHCPVYTSVGGHAYGWVYSGPMGKVLSPLLAEAGGDARLKKRVAPLPHASSFCGRCVEVCPVGIPLTDLMRKLRNRHFEHPKNISGWKTKLGCMLVRLLFAYPPLYRVFLAVALRLLRLAARGKGYLGHVAFLPGISGWTKTRDFPINRSARSAIASATERNASRKESS